jgi:hypothetical protein
VAEYSINIFHINLREEGEFGNKSLTSKPLLGSLVAHCVYCHVQEVFYNILSKG